MENLLSHSMPVFQISYFRKSALKKLRVIIKVAVYDVTVCDSGHREVFSICMYFRKGVHIKQVNVRETIYTVRALCWDKQNCPLLMEQNRLQQKVHTVKPRRTTQTRKNYFPTNSNEISLLLIKKLLKITPITLLGCHATGSSFCIISKNTT